MKELLHQLAMKNGRAKKTSKTKTKLLTADKKDAEALIAKLAEEVNKDHIHKRREPSIVAGENENVKFEKDTANKTSAEELENILQKLKFMGAKGKRVLELLKKQVILNEEDDVASTTPISPTASPATSSSPLQNETNETKSLEENLLRQKREFILKTALKSKELNDEDEESENLAIEEVRH